jgi:hypothetical protein
MRVSLLIAPALALGRAGPAAGADNPWLAARVLDFTARSAAFERVLRSHPVPEACG